MSEAAFRGCPFSPSQRPRGVCRSRSSPSPRENGWRARGSSQSNGGRRFWGERLLLTGRGLTDVSAGAAASSGLRRGAAETGPAQRTAETKAREGPVCGGRAQGPDSDSLEFGAIVSFVIGERVNARVAFKLGQVDVERLLLGHSLVLSLNFWGRRRDRWSKTRLPPRALCFRPNPTTKQLFCVI